MNDETHRAFDKIALTHTTRSKAFRYLSESEIKQAVRDPPRVYYDALHESWLLPVTRHVTRATLNHEREETIVLIVTIQDRTAVVISQTGDHGQYDWGNYERVDAVGAGGGT